MAQFMVCAFKMYCTKFVQYICFVHGLLSIIPVYFKITMVGCVNPRRLAGGG